MSGSWQRAVKTSNLKEGEYYIAVKAGSEVSIFDEKDTHLVAHFKWE